MKGFFEVGEKIGYDEALSRFPTRKNVIISNQKTKRELSWSYKDFENLHIQLNGKSVPKYLTTLSTHEGIYYQNPVDGHEIDNWKCNRLLLCDKNQKTSCIKSNKCNKDGITLSNYKNYVVANPKNWMNTDYLNISLNDLRNDLGFTREIKTKTNRHHVLRIDDFKDKLLEYIDQRSYRSTF